MHKNVYIYIYIAKILEESEKLTGGVNVMGEIEGMINVW